MNVQTLISQMSEGQKLKWSERNDYPFNEAELLVSPPEFVVPSLLEVMEETQESDKALQELVRGITKLTERLKALEEREPTIIVNIPKQEPPVVNVSVPKQSPPVVYFNPTVEAPEQTINVETPAVNVQPAKVSVNPVVRVQMPDQVVETTQTVKRDPTTGLIVSTTKRSNTRSE